MDTTNLWLEFLNPKVLRAKMLQASLFLVAHEFLVSTIVGRIKDFYTFGWSADNGNLISPSYQSKVLALDPKGKSDPLRSSVAWLKENQVIDESDEEEIRALTVARNVFAHELRAILSGVNSLNFDHLFASLMALLLKIERWWIINVEIDTDPELAGADVDHEGIVPGTQMIISIIYNASIGNLEEAEELYKQFRQAQET